MFMNLVITDLFKIKKNFVWKLVFLIPILSTCLLQLLIFIQFKSINNYSNAHNITGWVLLISQNSGPVLWPSIINLIIMIISISIYQVEFKNNSFNSQICFPISKTKILLSKFFIILIFTLISILLNLLGLVIVGIFNSISAPFPFGMYFKYFIFQCFSVLGTIALSNWIASLFESAIIPYVIGILGFAIGLILPHELKFLSYFFPYSYPLYAVNMAGFDGSIAILGGLISGVIILYVSSYEFINRDIN
ncbi:ABC transporter permease [Clostridium oceanicum]|uniref:ABC-2 family transporter protein n=1 Tax=Clostridium oceanicum TaxID=1543 RepID=A0ABP3V7H5_9CLOT